MIKLMPIVEQIQQEHQLDELSAKKAATVAAIAASSIFGGAKAQSKIPTDKPAITQSIKQVNISAEEKKSWDTFQKWLSDNGYAGDSSMNKDGFRKKVLNRYKQETGIDAPDTNFVKKLQQYQINSRNQIIKDVEAGRATIGYDYKTKGWDDFQPEVLSMEKHGGLDGKIGEETSKYKFRIWKDSKSYTVPGELK